MTLMGQMSLLKAIREYSPDTIGQFSVKVYYADQKFYTFKGEFTKAGKSLYSSFREMNLIAGSQDSNLERAKIKSIMRLLNLIDLRIRFFKKENDFTNLFFESISDDIRSTFTPYIEFLKEDEYYESESDIPVFSEELRKTGDSYTYIRTFQKTVENLNTIYTDLMKGLETKSDHIKKEFDVKVDDDSVKQSYEISVPVGV